MGDPITLTMVFPRDPRNHDDVWEYDWLREIFGRGPYAVRYVLDAKRARFEDDALLVVYRPDQEPEASYIREYARRGLRFGLVHLSDEWLKDERHAAYQAPGVRVVFRNYWRPAYPESSPRVVAFPLGCKSGFVKVVGEHAVARTVADRPYAWSFAGRLVRPERQRAIAAVHKVLGPGHSHSIPTWNAPTSLSTDAYARLMLDSVFVPVPVGNINIECFRMYEALEAGCIPIAVASTPLQPENYYARLFRTDDLAFPTVVDWERDLPALGLGAWSSDQREQVRLRCHAWFQQQKSRIRERMHRALVEAFGGR